MRTIDGELKACAVVALRNAMYQKMDELVSAVKAAAVGLDADPDVFYDIHAFGDAGSFDSLNVWAGHDDYPHINHHSTMLEALQDEGATTIHLEGVKVFEVVDGEWMYCERVDVSKGENE